MRRALAFAPLAALLAARAASACPSCAASTTAASGGGPGVWLIVGAFLLVPPLVALGVAAAVRRELRRAGDATAPRSASASPA